jgi:hypothetical protein
VNLLDFARWFMWAVITLWAMAMIAGVVAYNVYMQVLWADDVTSEDDLKRHRNSPQRIVEE